MIIRPLHVLGSTFPRPAALSSTRLSLPHTFQYPE